MPQLKLYIHTYGRSTNQATWNALPLELQNRCELVVQHREIDKYRSFPNVIKLPPGITRLSPTRQWMIENLKGHICMMDDDFINFGYRRHGDWHLKVATDEEIMRMFDWCEAMLNGEHAHVGISPRVNNHTLPDKTVAENCRMTQLLCYDLKVLKKHDFRFDRVPCMQDFDMTLQLLRAGYPNAVLYQGCTNARGTQARGGCTAYRTPDMQTRAANKLAKLHPGFVKTREKITKSWPEPLTDVTIQWKKAYASHQS